MTIKCSDFKLTQNAANAEPQKWRQIFAKVRPKLGWIVHTLSSRTEPNVRPNSSTEVRRSPNFGPSLLLILGLKANFVGLGLCLFPCPWTRWPWHKLQVHNNGECCTICKVSIMSCLWLNLFIMFSLCAKSVTDLGLVALALTLLAF